MSTMFLRKRTVKGIIYWSIVESYRDDGKVKQRIIENLGTTEKAYQRVIDRDDYKQFQDTISQYRDVKSPLIWFGGKSRLAKHIINLFPAHKTYVEPFGGAAHVIAQKPRSRVEIYNDINGDAVNFLLILRRDPERFYQAVESLPYSRELYENWRRSTPHEDSFERAVRWYYVNRGGIVGAYKGKPGGWRHGVQHNTVGGYRSALNQIEPFAYRLKNVNIENRDFREIINKYDSPETFFYVDPPYIGREIRYDGGFTQEDHIDLANLLNNIKGKALVSYYPHPMVNEMYTNWDVVELSSHAFSKKVAGNEEKPMTTELLLFNYSRSQMAI